MIEDKVYFKAGEIVILRQDIPNKPIMYIASIEKNVFKTKYLEKGNSESMLKGIKCRWFTNDGTLQEAIFNTKDLVKL